MAKTMTVGAYELSDDEDNDDVVTPPPSMPIAPPKPSAFKFPSGNRQPAPNPPLAPNPPPAHPQPTRPANTGNKSNASVKPGGRTTLPTPRQTPNETRSAWNDLDQELENSDVVDISSPVKHVQSKGKERAPQNQAGPSQPPASLSRERDMNELRCT
ncbi:hypothetical protein FRC09_009857, partial [Ceratobasidium sp. 395]